jgi:hypothetical protein
LYSESTRAAKRRISAEILRNRALLHRTHNKQADNILVVPLNRISTRLRTMKHFIRLAALLGLLILTGCPPPKSSDVILHVEFDGSLYDSSSNHFTVSASDTVAYTRDRFGRNNHAIALDGSATITVPNSPKLNFTGSSKYTISCWIRTRDSGDACLVAKGAANVAVPAYSLQLVKGKPTAIFAGSSGPIEISSSKSVADNVWHLLTLSVSPDSINIYADTTLVASGSGANLTPQQNQQGLLSIAKNPSGQKPFTGILDDLIMRSTATTINAVVHAYLAVKSLPVMGLNDMPPGVTDYQGILDVCWLKTDSIECGFACGTDKRFYTAGTPSSWTPPTTTGLPVKHYNAISFYDLNNGAMLSIDGKIYITSSAGATWTLRDPSPALGSTSIVRDIAYVNSTTLVIVGSKDWENGGPGFLRVMNPGNGTCQIMDNLVPGGPNGTMIEPTFGELRGLSVISDGSFTRILALGTNGDCRIYQLGMPGATQVNLSNGLHDCFESVDIKPQSPTFRFKGYAGTRSGNMWEYIEPNVGIPSWQLSTTMTGPPTSTLWVVGVRNLLSNTGWQVATGETVDANGIRTPLTKLNQFTNSMWVTNTSLQNNPQPVVVWSSGSQTFVIHEDSYNSNNSGLPGILLQ